MIAALAFGPLLGESTPATAASGEAKTVKVLGLGNSFLMNATGMLDGIVNAAGHHLVICRAAPGGWTLENHHAAAMLHEADPNDPKGKPYTWQDRQMSLKEVLATEDWDYVTIQQSSPNSANIESYRPHAANLVNTIQAYAPGAEVVFHQTWAWREDSSRGRLANDDYGQASMYQDLTRAYYTIADEVGIKRIIPVGTAFQLAAESDEWRFERDPDFDYDNPQYPNLPENERNSLHRGYGWRTQESKDGSEPTHTFRLDGSHASGFGRYLAACVWFEFFFNEDVREVNHRPGFLTEDQAASLREIAHQAATKGMRPNAWPADITGKKSQ